jgi:hypothetical protein
MTPNDGCQLNAMPQRDETADDLDLLTYNEARARLAEEVEAERRTGELLRRLAESPSAPESAAAQAEASLRRLRALRETLERTSTPRITAANAAVFYGQDAVEGGDTQCDRA